LTTAAAGVLSLSVPRLLIRLGSLLARQQSAQFLIGQVSHAADHTVTRRLDRPPITSIK
jgi:hypothetical protein